MAYKEIVAGQKYGRWTAIEKTKVYQGKLRTAWRCVCDCGTEKLVIQENLKNGKSLSCGCLARDVNSDMHTKHYDLRGCKFGDWEVIGDEIRVDYNGVSRPAWPCRCKCGAERNVLQDALLRGKSQSCGCQISQILKDIHTKHEDCQSRLYQIWTGMKGRCSNPNVDEYESYGGRGISVCDEWVNDYISFRDWAYANGYCENLTIDRIDNNLGYCPDNCRWADRIMQANNKRTNLRIEWRGETHTLAEWCRILNLPYKRTHTRLRYYGWDIDTLFTTA